MLLRLPLIFGAASTAALSIRAPFALRQAAAQYGPLSYASPLASRASGDGVRMMCAEAASPAADVPAAVADPSPYDLLDVRVGRIVEAWPHPDSDKLWCEKIDVGEEEPREIASGLRAYYPTVEEMTDRAVIVVCNLKPAKLAGFASNGMVLCASSEDRSKVAFVEPPEGSTPGERVLCEGASPVPPATGNQMKKKKLMEKAAEDLKAVGTVATYKGVPLVTAAGKCTSPTVDAGTIN